MTTIKTLIFTILIPGSVAALLPHWLLNSGEKIFPLRLGNFRYLGFLPLLAGILIYLQCAADFTFTGKGTPAPIDPPKELVVKGLYRFSRNPMYVGIIAILLGEAIFFQSTTLFVYAAIVFLMFNLFILLYEEPVLRRTFGAVYEEYCKKVPRWFRLKS